MVISISNMRLAEEEDKPLSGAWHGQWKLLDQLWILLICYHFGLLMQAPQGSQLSLLAYSFCCLNWGWDLSSRPSIFLFQLLWGANRSMGPTGYQQSLGEFNLGKRHGRGWPALPLPRATPYYRGCFLLPCISWWRGEGSWQLGWEETGAVTAHATPSPFLLLECLHDTQGKNASPESAQPLHQCQLSSRSALVGEKKNPLSVRFSCSRIICNICCPNTCHHTSHPNACGVPSHWPACPPQQLQV